MTSSTSADQLRVERRRDLVEQQQVGLHGQRAHDRDALLLAAGESVGVLVALVGQPEPRRAAPCASRARPRAADSLSTLRGASVTLSSTRHVREQVEGLEDDADAAPDAVDVDAAGR